PLVGQRGTAADHRGQGLVVHLDQVDAVLGGGPAGRHDDGHRVADVPGDPGGQWRCALLGRAAGEEVVDGEDGAHVVEGQRPGRVEPADAGVGVRAAHEGDVEGAGHHHVVDVAAPA